MKFWNTNGSPNAGLKIIPTFRLVNFAGPDDDSLKIKEIKKVEKYLNLAKARNNMEHIVDFDISCSLHMERSLADGEKTAKTG